MPLESACALSEARRLPEDSGPWDMGWVLGMGTEGLTRLDLRLGGCSFRVGLRWAHQSALGLDCAPEAGASAAEGTSCGLQQDAASKAPRGRLWAGQVDDQMSQTQAEAVFWEKTTTRPIFPFWTNSQLLASEDA